jgi:hypothetical protein
MEEDQRQARQAGFGFPFVKSIEPSMVERPVEG